MSDDDWSQGRLNINTLRMSQDLPAINTRNINKLLLIHESSLLGEEEVEIEFFVSQKIIERNLNE